MARSARKGGRIQPLPSAQDAKGEDNSYDLLITEADVGKRIDAFLASILPQELSRNRIKSLIQNGNVQLNQSLCDRPNQRLKQGDQIRIELPEPDDPAPKPEAIALDILYEDDSVIVINKPAGLVVHPAPGNWDGTLVNALIHHCGDTLRGIGGQKRPAFIKQCHV